ncbi:MAG TPA: methyltransferase domain-containing protein [Micromonosporaceae bacterium]
MANRKASRPIFARMYERACTRMDDAGLVEHRRRLLSGLTGRVIDVGAGNGGNFGHFPPSVIEVLAVEPEPHLRAAAERAATGAAVPVTVVDGRAERLPAEDQAFDAVVMSLVLCSVPDVGAALAEVRRVLRPSGQLRFLEHVQAERPGALRRVQHGLDATIWPLVVGGCHTGRDTVAAIRAAGFEVAALDRFRFPQTQVPLPTAPHVLGTAVRPA